ncbi:MAG: MBL fold metallo-hydrolase [Burkholderiaceae bacterium]|jgi:7,8-dihydropterin-6-yl-methyl-4-(beta-D-ribofuranosyl)aminobenzene 5'-phosphate synthase|nr:MBL fold metallo-hydrolase [Burkholderiaceae bacterium]
MNTSAQSPSDSSITLLVDNFALDNLESVPGLAARIKIGDRHILFDTGQQGVIFRNAGKLGIDLTKAEALVLSHGHDDHTDNLPDFYAMAPETPMYSGPNAHIHRFCCRPDEKPFDMSPPPASIRTFAELRSKGLINELREPHYFMPGVAATGPVPRLTSFEDTGDALFKDIEGKEVDPVEDDQSMWFETDKGLVILLGCCHSGIVNTVNYARKISGMDKVRGVIGGMHLLRAQPERMRETLKAMAEWDMEFIIPCHCTGENAKQAILQHLGSDIVTMGAAGTVVDLGNMTKP